MRLHRVTLKNYRGVTDCTVNFDTEGVTVVEGPNEVGKTSIAEALNLILRELDSSGKKAVKAIRPVHRDAGPQVEVEITSGDYRFKYSKRWHRGAQTNLEVTAPHREQLTGREAHARVEAILKETLDEDLWKALSIEQGTELGLPKLSFASLGEALDEAAGDDRASTGDDALLKRISEERLKYWTGTGRESRERKSLAESLNEAETRRDALEGQIRAIDDDAQEAARLTEEEAELDRHCAEAEAEFEELRQELDQLNKIRSQVELLEANFNAAEAQQNEAANNCRDRTERRNAVDACRDALTALADEEEQAAPALALAADRKRKTEADLSAAREANNEAQEFADLAGADRDFHRKLIEKDQLSERHERVIAARKDLQVAEETLDSIQVDDELVDRIEQATLDVASARAALSASAPTVEATAIAPLRARIDGVELELDAQETHQTEVTDSWELLVPDVVGVRVQAGAGSSDLSAELQAALARHDRLCGQGDVDNLAQARQKADERKGAERSQKQAKATIEQDLRDLTFEALAQKVDGLEKRTVAYAEERSETPPLPDDFEDAKRVAVSAENSLEVCRRELERCREEDKQAGEARQDAERSAAVDAERLNNAQSALEHAEKKLQEDRRQQSDDALDELLNAARANTRDASDELDQANEALTVQDPDTLEAKLDNARGVTARASNDRENNRRRQDELRGRLQAQGEVGLQSQLNEATSDFERLLRQQQSTEARADAAELLYQTFEHHRDAARLRYIEPFKKQIEQLGRIVFGPTFEVELDADLRVARRTLDGKTLDVEQLSVGAREQIGVICRLACAAIVSPHDGGAPVIIDDALGWSDPQRLKAMGTAMSKASHNSQVIVLTCTPGRYAHVGNAKVVRLPESTTA